MGELHGKKMSYCEILVRKRLNNEGMNMIYRESPSLSYLILCFTSFLYPILFIHDKIKYLPVNITTYFAITEKLSRYQYVYMCTWYSVSRM